IKVHYKVVEIGWWKQQTAWSVPHEAICSFVCGCRFLQLASPFLRRCRDRCFDFFMTIVSDASQLTHKEVVVIPVFLIMAVGPVQLTFPMDVP
ncbi:hypothetical protein Bpfe_002712, partial [Biomphalaria pfeifferi]